MMGGGDLFEAKNCKRLGGVAAGSACSSYNADAASVPGVHRDLRDPSRFREPPYG
jgi:hypothetical protein